MSRPRSALPKKNSYRDSVGVISPSLSRGAVPGELHHPSIRWGSDKLVGPSCQERRPLRAKGQVMLIYIRDKIHYEPSSQKRFVILNAKTSLTRNFIFQQCISEKTPAPVFPPNDVQETVVEKVTPVSFNDRDPHKSLKSIYTEGWESGLIHRS